MKEEIERRREEKWGRGSLKSAKYRNRSHNQIRTKRIIIIIITT